MGSPNIIFGASPMQVKMAVTKSNSSMSIVTGDTTILTAGSKNYFTLGTQNTCSIGPQTTITLGTAASITYANTLAYSRGKVAEIHDEQKVASRCKNESAYESYVLSGGAFNDDEATSRKLDNAKLQLIMTTIAAYVITFVADIGSLNEPIFRVTEKDENGDPSSISSANMWGVIAEATGFLLTVVLQWRVSRDFVDDPEFKPLSSVIMNNAGYQVYMSKADGKSAQMLMGPNPTDNEDPMLHINVANPQSQSYIVSTPKDITMGVDLGEQTNGSEGTMTINDKLIALSRMGNKSLKVKTELILSDDQALLNYAEDTTTATKSQIALKKDMTTISCKGEAGISSITLEPDSVIIGNNNAAASNIKINSAGMQIGGTNGIKMDAATQTVTIGELAIKGNFVQDSIAQAIKSTNEVLEAKYKALQAEMTQQLEEISKLKKSITPRESLQESTPF